MTIIWEPIDNSVRKHRTGVLVAVRAYKNGGAKPDFAVTVASGTAIALGLKAGQTVRFFRGRGAHAGIFCMQRVERGRYKLISNKGSKLPGVWVRARVADVPLFAQTEVVWRVSQAMPDAIEFALPGHTLPVAQAVAAPEHAPVVDAAALPPSAGARDGDGAGAIQPESKAGERGHGARTGAGESAPGNDSSVQAGRGESSEERTQGGVPIEGAGLRDQRGQDGPVATTDARPAMISGGEPRAECGSAALPANDADGKKADGTTSRPAAQAGVAAGETAPSDAPQPAPEPERPGLTSEPGAVGQTAVPDDAGVRLPPPGCGLRRQYDLLVELADNQRPMPGLGTLAKQLGLDQEIVAANLSALKKRKLITSHMVGARRALARVVTITATGRSTAEPAPTAAPPTAPTPAPRQEIPARPVERPIPAPVSPPPPPPIRSPQLTDGPVTRYPPIPEIAAVIKQQGWPSIHDLESAVVALQIAGYAVKRWGMRVRIDGKNMPLNQLVDRAGQLQRARAVEIWRQQQPDATPNQQAAE